MNAVWLKIDGECVRRTLQEAVDKLDAAQGELVLDFSSVHRIDPGALRTMEILANTVDGQAKIVLHGVNVDVYKVLKLMRLVPRFSFLT